MPCYTRTTVTLDLQHVSLDVLEKTLTDLGYFVQRNGSRLIWSGGSYDSTTNQLTGRSNYELQKIKKACSVEILKRQTARFGWRLKKINNDEYEVEK